jgi:hypothetical protein
VVGELKRGSGEAIVLSEMQIFFLFDYVAVFRSFILNKWTILKLLHRVQYPKYCTGSRSYMYNESNQLDNDDDDKKERNKRKKLKFLNESYLSYQMDRESRANSGFSSKPARRTRI